MEAAAGLAATLSNELLARADPSTATRPPVYKAIGITLAICSGLFIGVSFVLKKVGLLKANVKYNQEAGEGYGYLKNAYWWSGMTLMIIGEICNFVAYAFVDAILVTPLGALSVVVTTILSAIFLKERLSFVGKIGCFNCIIGSIIIVLNAPAQSSAATIQEMQSFVIAPGFLSYTGVILIGCAFVAFWVAPRYGKKSMLVYLTICSLIGGLSVVATQGLGAAVVAQAGGTPQFNQWFLYVLFVFVVCTLVTEIIFLNKALNLFNAALVTPTYYVYFTSSTIVASAILFRGFKGTPLSIATIIMGFLQICAGVVLLQLSKSAKDVPDAAVLSGDLDQIRTVGEQEQPESEPKADAIRGAAALIRRISTSRQKMEQDEARRVYEEKLKDQMEPILENEQVEWDGLRRRKTIIEPGHLQRRKTLHPPLGLTKFPEYNEDEDQTEADRPHTGRSTHSTGTGLFHFNKRKSSGSRISVNPTILSPRPTQSPISELPERGVTLTDKAFESEHPDDAMEMHHVYGLPPGLRSQQGSLAGSSRESPGGGRGKPIAWVDEAQGRQQRPILSPHVSDQRRPLSPNSAAIPNSARRQFSFQNIFHRDRGGTGGSGGGDGADDDNRTHKRSGSHLGKRSLIPDLKTTTEEERLGLVKGDSNVPSGGESSDESTGSNSRFSPAGQAKSNSEAALPSASRADHSDDLARYERQRDQWSGSGPESRTPGNGKALPHPPEEDDDHSGRRGGGFGGSYL